MDMDKKHSWNYGLTKEIDVRIANIAKSRHINHKGYKKKITKIILCKNCEKEIIISEKSNQMFCSKKCTTTWYHKNEHNKFYRWITDEPEKFAEHNRKVGIAQKGIPEKDWVKKQTSTIMKKFYGEHPERINILPALKALLDNKGMNKKENELLSFLDEEYPNQWKYVGDGKCWMTSKGRHINPDFIMKDSRKVIELYGVYWHRNDIPSERTNLFRNIGYNCLIIWENQINNKDLLKVKIDALMSGG